MLGVALGDSQHVLLEYTPAEAFLLGREIAPGVLLLEGFEDLSSDGEGVCEQ